MAFSTIFFICMFIARHDLARNHFFTRVTTCAKIRHGVHRGMGAESVAESPMLQSIGHENRHSECSNAWGVLDAASLRDDDLGAETFCRLGVTVMLHFIALGVNG